MDERDSGRSASLELAIGVRMRARRRQLGLSQGALAERLGVSFQQVQKYEGGVSRMAASTLLTAAEALGVTVGWLIGEDPSPDAGEDEIVRALARPGALELLEAFSRIDDARAREALVSLAREMAAGQAPV